MKLWITGADGFLGKAIQKACVEKGIEFVCSTKRETDISYLSQVFRFLDLHSPSHIVNCAALAHVDLAEKNPEAAFAANTKGPENLGIAATQRGISVVHFSTEYVFNGNSENRPYNEHDSPRPIGVYAATKREGEIRLLSALPTACLIRTSWLFGGEGKTFLSSLFNRIQNEKVLRVADDQKGKATYIYDLAEAALFFLDRHGIFHFANRGEVTRYEIAKALRETALEQSIPILCESLLPSSSTEFAQINKRPNCCVLDTAKVEGIEGLNVRHWRETLIDLVLHSQTGNFIWS